MNVLLISINNNNQKRSKSLNLPDNLWHKIDHILYSWGWFSCVVSFSCDLWVLFCLWITSHKINTANLKKITRSNFHYALWVCRATFRLTSPKRSPRGLHWHIHIKIRISKTWLEFNYQCSFVFSSSTIYLNYFYFKFWISPHSFEEIWTCNSSDVQVSSKLWLQRA